MMANLSDQSRDIETLKGAQNELRKLMEEVMEGNEVVERAREYREALNALIRAMKAVEEERRLEAAEELKSFRSSLAEVFEESAAARLCNEVIVLLAVLERDRERLQVLAGPPEEQEEGERRE